MQSNSKLDCFIKIIPLMTHHHHRKAGFFFHRRKKLAKTDNDHHHHQQHIRKGVIAMYVGKELKRYEVPVDYLNFAKVQELLKLSQEDEEYDYIIDGAIQLPCTTEIFDQVLLECAMAKGCK